MACVLTKRMLPLGAKWPEPERPYAKDVTMRLDADPGKLYVVNDKDTLRIRGTIPVGKRPCGITIVR